MVDSFSKPHPLPLIAVVGAGVWTLAQPNWWSCGVYLLVAIALIVFAFTNSTWENGSVPEHVAAPPVLAQPVFEESRHFAGLDIVADTDERKRIAQRLENRIKHGGMLSKEQAARAADSPWELDRIGLYLWEATSGSFPDKEPEIHVRHEFDPLERAKGLKVASHMPLYYAIESLEVGLRQKQIDPGAACEDLLARIENFLPAGDTKIRGRIKSIRQWIVEVRAVPPVDGQDAGALNDELDRAKRHAELAEKSTIKLRLSSLHMFMAVDNNGDAVVRDRYELLSATEGPVASLHTVLVPGFGFVPQAPQYDECDPKTQTVEWHFLEPKGDTFPAEVIFNPPVRETPISFTRRWTSYNGIYFNQRDRIDAKVDPPDRESFSHRVRHAYDVLTLRVQLPVRHFPSRSAVRAEASFVETINGADKRISDEAETAWIQNNLSVFEKDCVLHLVVPQPLPGHVYAITWSLPATDADEHSISTAEHNVGNEIIQRLNSVAAENSPYREAAIEALNRLAYLVEKRFGNDLRVRLFTHRRIGGKGGLVEVLDQAGSPPNLELVLIGRNPVGQAFRRQEMVTYQSIQPPVDPPNQYEPIPSEAGLPLPTGAVAVCLKCPVQGGLRIGVVYVASRNPNSKLVAVARNEGDAVTALDKILAVWYANQLASALQAKEMLQKVSLAAKKMLK